MRPRDAVVICSSRRTGSGLLCSALWSTDLCGRPDEYLDSNTRVDYEAEWSTDHRAYAEEVFARTTTPNGVFGVKVHWHQVEHRSWLAPELTSLAPRTHFFWVSRRDKVRQAVSMYVRSVTGRFRSLEGEPARSSVSVAFDYDAIRRFLDEAYEGDQGWSRYFDDLGVSPTRLWYEDDLECDYEATVRSVLTSISVEVPPDLVVATDYRKQADETSELLVQRFRDEVEQRARHD
jgi:LPS sulfotransferase NodH